MKPAEEFWFAAGVALVILAILIPVLFYGHHTKTTEQLCIEARGEWVDERCTFVGGDDELHR